MEGHDHMPGSITSADEQRLLDAVKTASDLVDAGTPPDAAVEKVARDHGFGPGQIRLVAQAYNTGRQTSQWRRPTTSLLDKLAEYPLCDPANVISAIYAGPSSAEKAAAAAVSSDYSRPPVPFTPRASLTKAAAFSGVKASADVTTPAAGDSPSAVRRQLGNADRAKRAAEELRLKAAAARDAVAGAVGVLVGYFKQASSGRLSFDHVEEAASAYFGPAASALMDAVHPRVGFREKRAGAVPAVRTTPVDLTAEPFTTISRALHSARECGRLTKEAADAKLAAASARDEAFRPFQSAGAETAPAPAGPWSKEADALLKVGSGWTSEVAAIATGDILAHKATHQPEESEDPYGDVADIDDAVGSVRRQAQLAGRRKQAFLNTPAVGAAVGTVLGRTVGTMPKPKEDMVEDAWMDLEDPEHANELRKIRAHAMLNQMLTDPDDPISGHSPEKVLNAYNEIARSAPRLAEDAATLRPHLRKRLESHSEPFEAKEMLDTEKALAQTRLPTPSSSLLGETPDKLLG